MKEAKDPSHALDLVTIFEASGTTAEMEAIGIQAVLKAAGIRVVVGGESILPYLPWSIAVPKADLARARQVIEDAKKAGPRAAEQGEAEQERSKK
jgi:hypothetical protein